MSKIFALTLTLVLAACGGMGKTKSEEFIDLAKQNCQQLGYEPNTKPYLDCTTEQYNKMQERYYGPLQ
jgi:hypothetical protein